MRSGFFNSNIDGYDDYGNPIYDRAEEASFFAEYFAAFIGNGIYPNPSTGMQVAANGGFELSVQPGKCFIKGYFGKVEEGGETISIEPSDTSYNRIDRIVARLTIEERKIKLAVLKGTPGSTPVVPELMRNSNIYELGLANILVNKNASVITQANITDTRLNSSICGIVSGVIEQVDPTTLFNQYLQWFTEQQDKADAEYQKWFDGFTVPSEAEFTNWFNNVKDQLSEDAAGNLQNQLDDLWKVFPGKAPTKAGKYIVIERDPENGARIVMISPAGALPLFEEKIVPKEVLNCVDYSMFETKVGTWIDGKPIYRKVINFGALPNAGFKQVEHNIADLDFLVHKEVIACGAGRGQFIGVPDSNTNLPYNIQIVVTKSVIGISTGVDRSSYSECYVTLEYTKTTD